MQVINRNNELNYIDIFYEYENVNKLYLFYNSIDNKYITNTIIVQKKSNLNTFFTINALNSLISLHGNNEIPWEIYNNKLIILKRKDLDIIEIQFKLRVNLN
jgi:hypothetical protein